MDVNNVASTIIRMPNVNRACIARILCCDPREWGVDNSVELWTE